jgi:hypothetical protein
MPTCAQYSTLKVLTFQAIYMKYPQAVPNCPEFIQATQTPQSLTLPCLVLVTDRYGLHYG